MADHTVEAALEEVLRDVSPPARERVPLAEALGRTLAEPVRAARDQPPFEASAMDGYALRAADLAGGEALLSLVGESVAGRRHAAPLPPGAAVRILTGAPLPEGADTVIPQEDAERLHSSVRLHGPAIPGRYVRPAGLDLRVGDLLLAPGVRLGPRELSLAAAAGWGALSVAARPLVAVLGTGDELVAPGQPAGPDSIYASTAVGIAAAARAAGAATLDLGLVPDETGPVEAELERAVAAGAAVLVTLGGVSVGDRDVVRAALARGGVDFAIERVALRPGRPMAAGRRGTLRVLALPGNPVSSFVCTLLFLKPLIRSLLGADMRCETFPATLTAVLPVNEGRQDYLRATLGWDAQGRCTATPSALQDSSMLRVFARAEGLIVRPPRDPARAAGDPCRVLPISWED